MSALGVAVIAVALVVTCVAASFADRLLDATVGGSYVLVQMAWRRRVIARFGSCSWRQWASQLL